MSDAKNQQAEPSMEEILASIRRIISEDSADAGKGQPAAAAPAAAPSPAPPPAPAPTPTPVPTAEAPSPPPAAATPAAPVAAAAPTAADVLELTEMVDDDGKVTEIGDGKPSAPPVDDDGLVSHRAASAAAGALAGLHAASRKGDDLRSSIGLGNGGMTLEEIVRSELRPILKDWLDENLPLLVERLVQKEIKRITRQVEET